MTPQTLLTCQPEWEEPLQQELRRSVPRLRSRRLSPGWIALNGRLEPGVSLAFAQQVIPDALPIRQDSSQKLATDGLERVQRVLQNHSGPWRLHVFGVEFPHSPVTRLRAQRVEEALLAKLALHEPRLLDQRCTRLESPWKPEEVLIQLGLETPSSAWFSVLTPERRTGLQRILSRFPGGRVEAPDDPAPPSTAFKKVVEAQLQLGHFIRRGETCVDLGGCPGGWSFIALRQGASVIAVDRSPLREDLLRNPSMTFLTGDAFKFIPAQRVDWLLCDVIAYPERSIELLTRWLSERLCRAFIVSIKFKGREDDARLEQLKGLLASHTDLNMIRHLQANKNEVTAMGVLPESVA